jgi:hypothetical protein
LTKVFGLLLGCRQTVKQVPQVGLLEFGFSAQTIVDFLTQQIRKIGVV